MKIPSIQTILVAGTCGLLVGCYVAPETENDVLKVIPSPDGKRQLVLFTRGSGATSRFNTQATLLQAGQPLPNEGGNVFIVDQGDVSVSWKDDYHVEVVFDRETRVFKREPSVAGIAFEYRQKQEP